MPVFSALSERAEAEGRLRNATSYLRLTEFFARKRAGVGVALYRRYRDLFDRACRVVTTWLQDGAVLPVN